MLRVLQSFSAMRDTTNPYLKQLYEAIASETRVSTFSWPSALRLDFDVLHVHWPELLMRGSSAPKTWMRRLFVLVLLLRIRCSRKALVRTLHNPRPHETGPWAERRLLTLFDRWTTLFIRLVDSTPAPAGSRGTIVTIPHGSYRDWFADVPVPAVTSGRFLYFGLIRNYKGVDQLLSAFGSLETVRATLRIVGSVKDPDTAELVTAAIQADRRITAHLAYLPDAELAAEIGSAELVVLPYRDMHNSGAALLALSLNRPILVPSNDVTTELALEVGAAWVHTFSGELTPHALQEALEAVRRADADRMPDLAAREWAGLGEDHVRAYCQALLLRSRRATRHLPAVH